MKKLIFCTMLLLAMCFTACQSTIPAAYPECPDNDKSPPQITVSNITIIGETNDTIPDTAKLVFSEKGETVQHHLSLLLIPTNNNSLTVTNGLLNLYYLPQPRDKLTAYITNAAQNLIAHCFY